MTSACRACGAKRLPRASTVSATAAAPDDRLACLAGGRAPASTRKTASGSSTATSASKSPARAAARNAVTTSRWRARSASGDRRRAADAPPSPARELTRRIRRPVEDRSDLVERNAEHVVEHEGQPLRRRQRLEHDEEREPDGVRKQRFVLRPRRVVDDHDRLGQPAPDVVLAPSAPRAQHVEADAPDDGREPGAEVLDRGGVRAAQPQPRFLQCVVGLAHRAEHAIRDRLELRPVPLELLHLPVACAHRSHPVVGIRHSRRRTNRGRM